MTEEGLKKTDNELIHIGAPIPFDRDLFLKNLETLMKASYANDDNIREMLIAMVPTYHPVDNKPTAPVVAVYDAADKPKAVG